MLGKLLFYVIAFVLSWTGIMLTFRCYVVPGVLIAGVGVCLFNVLREVSEN